MNILARYRFASKSDIGLVVSKFSTHFKAGFQLDSNDVMILANCPNPLLASRICMEYGGIPF